MRWRLVARGLPEGSAVVVAAEEFVGLGVDGDEFAVAPDAGVVFVGDGEAVDGVAHAFELVGYICGKFLFEVDAVGQGLVVEARGVDCLAHYCLSASGGPLTRAAWRLMSTSTRLATLMKGMPLFIP